MGAWIEVTPVSALQRWLLCCNGKGTCIIYSDIVIRHDWYIHCVYRWNTRREWVLLLLSQGLFVTSVERSLLHTAHVWPGKYKWCYTGILLFYSIFCLHVICRLGEVCSHVAAIISCLVRASEAQSKSGATSCTSQKCSWLPASRDVSVTAVYSYVHVYVLP